MISTTVLDCATYESSMRFVRLASGSSVIFRYEFEQHTENGSDEQLSPDSTDEGTQRYTATRVEWTPIAPTTTELCAW